MYKYFNVFILSHSAVKSKISGTEAYGRSGKYSPFYLRERPQISSNFPPEAFYNTEDTESHKKSHWVGKPKGNKTVVYITVDFPR